LYNFDAVRDALLIVSDNEGIGISAAASRCRPRRGAEHRPHRGRNRVMLAISLHAVRDELRTNWCR